MPRYSRKPYTGIPLGIKDMKDKLTTKQERFVRNLFGGMSQRDAYIKAGYSPKSALTTIDHHACELAKTAKVKARLAELQEKADSALIMPVKERKERLSEIARARVTDFVRCSNGVARITVEMDTVNSAALQEVVSEEIQLGRGEGSIPVKITKLKLRDPVAAIAELNKMDGAYAPEKNEVIVYDGIKIALIDRLSRLANSRRQREIPQQSESSGNTDGS